MGQACSACDTPLGDTAELIENRGQSELEAAGEKPAASERLQERVSDEVPAELICVGLWLHAFEVHVGHQQSDAMTSIDTALHFTP